MNILPDRTIPDVKFIESTRHADRRGYFSETYRSDRLREAGIADAFVQENESFSEKKGTVRGLHFQVNPSAQAKLVRVITGSVLDVVVDLRRGSATFGRSVRALLDSRLRRQLYVPVGFAHGFCTLEDNVLLSYKVSAYYDRKSDRGLRWDDPALQIDWPVSCAEAILSDKDRSAPLLRDLTELFY